VQLLHCVSENIPNIFDYKLKKDYQIGTNIPETTGHQMTIQFLTAPKVCSCTTSEKQNQRSVILSLVTF